MVGGLIGPDALLEAAVQQARGEAARLGHQVGHVEASGEDRVDLLLEGGVEVNEVKKMLVQESDVLEAGPIGRKLLCRCEQL